MTDLVSESEAEETAKSFPSTSPLQYHYHHDTLEPTYNFNEYIVPEFVNTHPIIDMHFSPRAGHTNNVTTIIEANIADISESRAITKDYVLGIIFAAILVTCVFVVWFVVLIVFKCLGYDRVGWLSGTPPPSPSTTVLTSSDPKIQQIDSSKQNELSDDNSGDNTSADIRNEDKSEISEQELTLETNDKEEENFNDDDDDSDNEMFYSVRQTEDEILPSSVLLASLQPSPEEANSKEEQVEPSNSTNTYGGSGTFSAIADRESKRIKHTFIVCRTILLISCIVIIVASILMLTKGVGSLLEDSINSIQNALLQADNNAQAGIQIIDQYELAQNNTIDKTKEFLLNNSISVDNDTISNNVNNFEGFCPGLLRIIGIKSNSDGENDNIDSTKDLCSNVTALLEFTNSSADNGEGLVEDIFAIKEVCGDAVLISTGLHVFRDIYKNLTKAVYYEIRALRDDLVEISLTIERLNYKINSFEWTIWISAAFVILLDIVVLLIMYGVIQAWRGNLSCIFRCIRGTVIMPVFIGFLFLMWIFATVFIIGSIVTADFCYDSPDDNILLIVQDNKDKFVSFIYYLLIYWIDGCRYGSNVFPLDDTIHFAAALVGGVHDLLGTLASANMTVVSEFCESDTILSLQNTVIILDKQLHVYANAVRGVKNLLSCANWNPIYVDVAYEAACYHGVEGLTWLYSSLFTIGFFGMIVIMLRFAMYKAKDKNKEIDSK